MTDALQDSGDFNFAGSAGHAPSQQRLGDFSSLFLQIYDSLGSDSAASSRASAADDTDDASKTGEFVATAATSVTEDLAFSPYSKFDDPSLSLFPASTVVIPSAFVSASASASLSASVSPSFSPAPTSRPSAFTGLFAGLPLDAVYSSSDSAVDTITSSHNRLSRIPEDHGLEENSPEDQTEDRSDEDPDQDKPEDRGERENRDAQETQGHASRHRTQPKRRRKPASDPSRFAASGQAATSPFFPQISQPIYIPAPVVPAVQLAAQILAPPPSDFIAVPYAYSARSPETAYNKIEPLYWVTREKKLAYLAQQLVGERSKDRKLAVSQPANAAVSKPLHVFVDLSNIVIGFYQQLRVLRNIPQWRKLRAPPFFFEAFSLIIERGRSCERKVTAGSVAGLTHRLEWPSYMHDAEKLGYEMNILTRVSKQTPASPSSTRRRPGGSNHGRRNGHDSSPWPSAHPLYESVSEESAMEESATEVAYPIASGGRKGEQAVDEILQLKMCQSMLDCDPGVIVLATGDAACAEFSDGFLRHVERALRHGWVIELVAWRTGISSAWRELEKRENRSGKRRFRVIELDAYAEELLGYFDE